MTRPTISVADHTQLFDLVHATIRDKGTHCDLNHIDVSGVTELRGLFAGSDFDGDVSQWDVAGVTNFASVFAQCPFAGDLSKWNTRSAVTMQQMFHSNARFQGDVSEWDVSNVQDFSGMFANAAFQGDLSSWTPHSTAIWSSAFSVGKLKAMPQPSIFHWFYATACSTVFKENDVLQPEWQAHLHRMRPMLNSLALGDFDQWALLQRSWVAQQGPALLPTLPLPDLCV